jgi:DNA-binding NarL/FixJ family response regulator
MFRPRFSDETSRRPSPREREVAELVATGQANKQIAATLY